MNVYIQSHNIYVKFEPDEFTIVSSVSFEPRVHLAIEGRSDDGWYTIGEIEIRENIMKDRKNSQQINQKFNNHFIYITKKFIL